MIIFFFNLQGSKFQEVESLPVLFISDPLVRIILHETEKGNEVDFDLCFTVMKQCYVNVSG